MRTHRLCTAMLLGSLAACDGVPSLTFEQGDASSGDGGAGDAADGGSGCPSSLPPGAYLCCDTVPCYGPLCSPDGSCPKCATCAPPDICCARNGTNAVCSPQAQCH